jgi:hypothetical protein
MRKTHSPLGAALSPAVLAPLVAIPLAALHISPADAQAIVIAPAAPPRVEPPLLLRVSDRARHIIDSESAGKRRVLVIVMCAFESVIADSRCNSPGSRCPRP